MRHQISLATFFLGVCMLCIPSPASSQQKVIDKEKLSTQLKPSDPRSGEVPFQCGSSTGQTLGNFLAHLTTWQPHTIRVSGACHENITIIAFERLTLLAAAGASMNDASGGVQPAVIVAGASTVDFEGFTVNGGGGGGVFICAEYSTCTFSGNVFQGSSDDGVRIARSSAIFLGDVIQNHASRGIAVVNGGQAILFNVTLQGNGAAGAAVVSGSNFTAQSIIVQNNGGAGLRVSLHATVRLFDCLITGNGTAGINADGASEVEVSFPATGTIITNNGTFGVRLGDLSFASFQPGNSVTGNLAGLDVLCAPQFSGTRGALTNINGGTTNCVEP